MFIYPANIVPLSGNTLNPQRWCTVLLGQGPTVLNGVSLKVSSGANFLFKSHIS